MFLVSRKDAEAQSKTPSHSYLSAFPSWRENKKYTLQENNLTNPQYLGRIDCPEYNCYIIREVVVKDDVEWIEQRLYRLDNNEEVGRQSSWFANCRLKGEDLLDSHLWQIDRELSQRRSKAKQLAFYSGPYQAYSLEKKKDYWLAHCHYMKRVAFEESPLSPSTAILNLEWKKEQSAFHSLEEIEAIVEFVIKEVGPRKETAMKMLEVSSRTEEWGRLSSGSYLRD